MTNLEDVKNAFSPERWKCKVKLRTFLIRFTCILALTPRVADFKAHTKTHLQFKGFFFTVTKQALKVTYDYSLRPPAWLGERQPLRCSYNRFFGKLGKCGTGAACLRSSKLKVESFVQASFIYSF